MGIYDVVIFADDATREDILPHPTRTESPGRLYQGPYEERIYSPIQEPICVAILLHQKEGRQIMPSARLPTSKRMDHPQSLPMIPAVPSGRHVVDGYVRVGPNWWSRRSDVSGG